VTVQAEEWCDSAAQKESDEAVLTITYLGKWVVMKGALKATRLRKVRDKKCRYPRKIEEEVERKSLRDHVVQQRR
jgi:hypothetical protein